MKSVPISRTKSTACLWSTLKMEMFSTSSIRNHCSGAKFQDRGKFCHQVLPSFIKKTTTRFLYHYVPNLAGSPHLGISIAEANVGSYNDIQVKWNNLWK